jgi:hypothetical protein
MDLPPTLQKRKCELRMDISLALLLLEKVSSHSAKSPLTLLWLVTLQLTPL